MNATYVVRLVRERIIRSLHLAVRTSNSCHSMRPVFLISFLLDARLNTEDYILCILVYILHCILTYVCLNKDNSIRYIPFYSLVKHSYFDV